MLIQKAGSIIADMILPLSTVVGATSLSTPVTMVSGTGGGSVFQQVPDPSVLQGSFPPPRGGENFGLIARRWGDFAAVAGGDIAKGLLLGALGTVGFPLALTYGVARIVTAQSPGEVWTGVNWVCMPLLAVEGFLRVGYHAKTRLYGFGRAMDYLETLSPVCLPYHATLRRLALEKEHMTPEQRERFDRLVAQDAYPKIAVR